MIASRIAAIVIALATCAGCKISAAFHCETDPQCTGGGVCQTAVGYCSFADTGCASGQRYDDYAGDGLAGMCVGGESEADGAPQPDGVIGAIDGPPGAIDARPADGALPPDGASLIFRRHEGGATVVGVDYPGTWTGDPSHTVCPGASLGSTADAINGTVDDALFMTNAYDIPNLDCSVPALPDGMYQVRLLFVELYYDCSVGTPGDHHMDVSLEGMHVGPTLSSRNDGGGCATEPGGHPFALQTLIPITDGTLDIHVDGNGTYGMVAGIEVIGVP